MENYQLLWMAAIMLMALGLVGLFAPVLPGSVLLLAGFFVGAYADGFAYVGWGTLAILVGLAVLMQVVDFALGAVGARQFGASRRGMIGALLGALVGIFFGVPGIILGPFVGAVAGELSGRRDLLAAGRAGLGASLGLIAGSAAKLAIAFTMICLFALMRLT